MQEVDRLGRNLLEGLIVLNDLFERGVAVKVLEGIAAGEHLERSRPRSRARPGEDRRRDIARKTRNGLDSARVVAGSGAADRGRRRASRDPCRKGEGQSLREIARGVEAEPGCGHRVVTEHGAQPRTESPETAAR